MDRRGYSLVELVVTLVVIGVLGAFVAPVLLASSGHHRLDAVEIRLREGFDLARRSARASGAPVEISFDPMIDQISMRGDTLDEIVEIDESPYSADLRTVTVGERGDTIRIKGNGRLEAPARILVGAGRVTRVLIFSDAGVVREEA